jgi:hypothetical protein
MSWCGAYWRCLLNTERRLNPIMYLSLTVMLVTVNCIGADNEKVVFEERYLGFVYISVGEHR